MANLSNINNKFLVTTGGNVLIGQTTAVGTPIFQVTGTNHLVTFKNTNNTANTYAQMLLQAGDATNYIWTAAQNSTNWAGSRSLNIYTAQTGANIGFFTEGDAINTKLMILGDGNVGIGVNDPTEMLTIVGSSSSPATSGTGVNGILAIESANGNSLYIGSYTASPFGCWLQASNRGNQAATYPIILNPNGGNVGIGTISPIEKLQVVGQVISTGSNSTSATAGAERAIMDLSGFSATDHSARFGHFRGTNSAGAGQLRLYTDSVERVRIDANGNVGINQTNPQALLSLGAGIDAQKLLLYDDNNNFKYGFGIQSAEFRQFFPNSATARMVFGTISDSDGSTFSEKMRITSSGQVGIGGTPQTALADAITIEIGASGIIYSEKAATQYNSVSIGSNWYYDTTNSRVEYKNAVVPGATNYLQYRGEHFFRTAVAPTAANDPITWSDRLVILNSGNVGIGNISPTLSTLAVGIGSTNSPSQICQLAGSGSGVYSVLSLTNTNGIAADNNGVGLDFHVNAAYSPTGRIQLIHPTAQSGTTTNASMQFLTYGTVSGVTTFSPRMTIDYRGSVGIGVTSPEGTGTNLDVYGAGYFGYQDFRDHDTYPPQKVFVLRGAPKSGFYAQSRFNWYTKSGTTANGVAAIQIKSQYGTDAESDVLFHLGGNGKLGIGTNSPSEILQTNKNSAGNIVGGYFTNSQANTGAESVSLAFGLNRSGGDFVRQVKAITFGAEQQWTGTPSTVDGYLAFSTISDETVSERMRITSTGTIDVKGQNNNVNGMAAIIARLGTNCDNTTSYAFIAETGTANRCFIHGNGNIVNANDSYGALSDERLKENIIDATPKLHDLMKVKVRNFNLKGDKTKQIGVVAQELEEVFPNMIDETKGLNPDDETLYKSVKYSVFVPMLIKAIQELEARIKELENK